MSCTIGNATNPTRAATANERRIANVSRRIPMEIANGIGANTAAPPANARTLLPPRNPANTGNEWPSIAAPHPT
jgi:hypothetical protein